MSDAARITVRPNGPYLVKREIEVFEVNGWPATHHEWTRASPRAVSLPKGSATKPFPDGTSRRLGPPELLADVANGVLYVGERFWEITT